MKESQTKPRNLFSDKSFGKAVSDACNKLAAIAKTRCLPKCITALSQANEQGSGTLGHVARQARLQFAGYLLANRDRERISAAAGPYSHLSQEDLALISDAHATLMEFINFAAAKIAPKLPKPNVVMNIYHYLGILPLGSSMLGEEDFEKLTNALAFTEPGRFLGALNLSTAQENAEEVLIAASDEIERRIIAAGVSSAPEDLVEMALFPGHSVEHEISRVIVAIIRMRAMLRNACQLMFQMSIGKKPAVLGENNLFALQAHKSIIGEGYEVDCQPTGDELFAHPGDLLLLDYPELQIKKLCQLEHNRTNFSREDGVTQHFHLRGLDTNLDPFAGLALLGV